MLNKKIQNITLQDLVNTGVYDEVDFDKKINLIRKDKPGAKKELMKILDRGNQRLKETFINRELERVNHNYKKVDPEFNLITTDYFKDEIDNKLIIVASRTVESGPEKLTEEKQHWLFKGFITFGELEHLPRIYPVFEDLYSEYNRPDWQLELNVIGGVTQGQLLISTDSIQDWRKEGVLFEPWGFDENGQMTSFTELLVRAFQDLKKEAASIKETGGPENLDEARILKLDREGRELFNNIFSSNMYPRS